MDTLFKAASLVESRLNLRAHCQLGCSNRSDTVWWSKCYLEVSKIAWRNFGFSAFYVRLYGEGTRSDHMQQGSSGLIQLCVRGWSYIVCCKWDHFVYGLLHSDARLCIRSRSLCSCSWKRGLPCVLVFLSDRLKHRAIVQPHVFRLHCIVCHWYRAVTFGHAGEVWFTGSIYKFCGWWHLVSIGKCLNFFILKEFVIFMECSTLKGSIIINFYVWPVIFVTNCFHTE